MWRTNVRKAWFALALVGGAFTLTGCRGITWNKKEEVRIGQQIAAEVERVYKLDPDPRVQERVQTIGQRIVALVGDKDFKFSFKVLESPEVNAFALPGGPIYVFRGLIDLVGDDDDMLACVLAHEIAHVNRRHANKQYTQGLWRGVIISLTTRGKVRDAAEIADVLMQLRYSRQHEYEADRLAVEYAYKAGYDPNGLIRFLELLKREEKIGNRWVETNLRTHPFADRRLEEARKHIQRLTGQPAAQPTRGGSQ
ncbi:MAG: M48 family metallopeptidase [Armatimonadota bacterium]|nr:M48 family metallopeptidase [Armatimonadota bacterium]